MSRLYLITFLLILHNAATVKVKVIMDSDEDSRIEDEVATEVEKKEPFLPFLKKRRYDYEEKQTEKPKPMHPNEMLFPLIYRQSHISSMFKFGENWYTWSTEKRSDGSKAVNYYICYDEPKHCDEVGWERTDTIPKCAFQIEALTADDRACVNSFGVEAHASTACDGGEQMKVSDMVHACGPRIRSLWRFVRSGRRPASAAKPADVNSLVCEDEDECFLSVEYRIHHDRITFSLHEPTRGQTFKSALKREVIEDKVTVTPDSYPKFPHKVKKPQEPNLKSSKKIRNRKVDGKGTMKERNDSGYSRRMKNKIKVREDISDDVSE